MLICGAEEPIRPNPMLYAAEPGTGRIVHSSFDIARGSRYSLLWLGNRQDASSPLSLALARTVQILALAGTWCIAWPHPTQGDFAGQARTRKWRYEKRGWTVTVHDDVGVATKIMDPRDVTWPPLSDPKVTGSRHMVLLVDSKTGSQPVLRALEPSTLAMLASWGMAPNERVIERLLEHDSSVFYSHRDDTNRTGLVMVGAKRMPVATLESEGLIARTYWNEEAYTVWRHSFAE